MMKVLLAPAVGKGMGTGHLKRCLRLLGRLGGQGRILLPRDAGGSAGGAEYAIRSAAPDLPPEAVIFRPGDFEADLVVFDRRATGIADFRDIGMGRVTVGLDEGGPSRRLFSYLVDTFPRLSRNLPPNVRDPGLIADGPPGRGRERPDRLRTILVSFGGEDPAGLTNRALRTLLESGLFLPRDIHVVQGPAFSSPVEAPGAEVFVMETGSAARKAPPGGKSGADPRDERIRVFRGLGDLRPILGNYDAVLTSFGLTPYEAEKEGAVPLLLDPSPYHRRLSRREGFSSLGLGKINRRKLETAVLRPGSLPRRKEVPASPGSLSGLVRELRPSGTPLCPVCGEGENPAAHRREDASFFRCRRCGMRYMLGFSPREMVYNEDYFFRDYRAQYGRTYLEDFDAIREISRRRLDVLVPLLGGAEGRMLLDVGCAYGPFLAAARDAGFAVQGLDVSESAVRHVRERLGIPAERGDFLTWEEGKRFDVLSLWYVAEHFNPLRRGLEKAAELVKPGGFLALSTPNARGLTGRFYPEKFHARSPRDHYTLWDPSSARRALDMFGFRIRRIRFTGIHPDRYPAALRALLGERGCRWAGRFFGLGDTFEIYAQRLPHG